MGITARDVPPETWALLNAQPTAAASVICGKIIRFTVPGNPIGKPRMTQRDKWKKRSCVVAYRNWADRVREIAGVLPPPDRIASVSWVAYFAMPPSWSKKKRAALLGQLHRSKPDRDNIDKALLDVLFTDDSGIAAGSLEKRWSTEPRLEVTIEVL